MASPSAKINFAPSDESDYGSDFTPEEEELIVQKLIAVASLQETAPLPDIEDIADFSTNRRAQNASRTGMRRSPRRQADQRREMQSTAFASANRGDPIGFTYPAQTSESKFASTSKNANRPGREEPLPDNEFAESFRIANEQESENTKSPLERFRSNQNKQALSVTDLISTSWCELQYFYQMRTGRRKKATAAMKQGSSIHQALEDQVSKPVVVATTTREDGWALRFWNVIQGLKTLRDTGITRELEIWGFVDGQVVNGVIDQLSYICPDEDMEYHLQLEAPSSYSPVDPNQKTISEYFQGQPTGSLSFSSATGGKSFSSAMKSMNTHERLARNDILKDTRKIYITDVKTRRASGLPNPASFRPTKMQLMLYHRILSNLCIGNIDFPLLASRYNLDITAPFSDSFIAEMSNIQDEPYSNPSPEEDPLPILLAHNNLSLLWTLMISEFALTFPNGKKSIGNVLQAEYRQPSLTAEEGRILGSKTFPMSEYVLDVYIEYEMRFWKGEREPVGVVLGEAFKCGYCDFAAGCEWRRDREEEISELTGKVGAAKITAKKGKRIEIKVETSSDEEANNELRKLEAEIQPSDTSNTENITKKRKPGRPRKTPPPENQDESSNPDSPPPSKEKRKPGRPRKIKQEIESSEAESQVSSEEPKLRRGRGRPKKVRDEEKENEFMTTDGSMAISDSEWVKF